MSHSNVRLTPVIRASGCQLPLPLPPPLRYPGLADPHPLLAAPSSTQRRDHAPPQHQQPTPPGPAGQDAPAVDSAPAAQAALPIRFVPHSYFQLQQDIN